MFFQVPVWVQQFVNWLFIVLDSQGVPWQVAMGAAIGAGIAIAAAFRVAFGR